MSDTLSDALEASSPEHVVHGSARPLAWGFGLLLGGGLLATFGTNVSPVLAIPAVLALLLGVVGFVVGTYRFADNVDRAAKALISGRRD